MIQKIKGVNIVYKLFLVDDEIWVIRGLMKMIPWEELGFEIDLYDNGQYQCAGKDRTVKTGCSDHGHPDGILEWFGIIGAVFAYGKRTAGVCFNQCV